MISIFNLKYYTLLYLLLIQIWHSQMSFLCFVTPSSESIYNTCENENAKEGGKKYVFTKDKYSTAIYIYYSCEGLKKHFINHLHIMITAPMVTKATTMATAEIEPAMTPISCWSSVSPIECSIKQCVFTENASLIHTSSQPMMNNS